MGIKSTCSWGLSLLPNGIKSTSSRDQVYFLMAIKFTSSWESSLLPHGYQVYFLMGIKSTSSCGLKNAIPSRLPTRENRTKFLLRLCMARKTTDWFSQNIPKGLHNVVAHLKWITLYVTAHRVPCISKLIKRIFFSLLLFVQFKLYKYISFRCKTENYEMRQCNKRNINSININRIWAKIPGIRMSGNVNCNL
jgi:hypothetical protein